MRCVRQSGSQGGPPAERCAAGAQLADGTGFGGTHKLSTARIHDFIVFFVLHAVTPHFVNRAPTGPHSSARLAGWRPRCVCCCICLAAANLQILCVRM